ncbi:prolipoprotein diacylglyceryl transferase [Planococcus lenghuensis]|uniref:Phosphatidylglycerol--prolipoprotein diacylglyceryl transferase n=1 Tax=Planococcus lenghuensis TaxID=2213202 RepID=A0A1Q2KYG9_9BACL|nr:prolipoprotein diacylglyceryl transferase [Planococcus lenghuensis]AQQ53258.1 prolipoprotein diacylglyceryl transferase [Planococcus lenghuensis]
MLPLFSVGPFTVYFFGLMIAIGALAGYLLLIQEAKRRNMDHDTLSNGIFYSLIGGIVGARIFYVVVYNPAYYLANPMDVFFIHNGGLSIHGGILGGLLVGYLFLKKHNFPVLHTLDLAAPALILAQGISRIGCDVFGGPISTSLPWGIDRAGEILHPAQAYEFLLDFLLFGYLWLKLKKRDYTGQIFLHYLIGYMIIRAVVEFSRINPMVIGPFSVSHVMSLIGVVIGLLLIRYRKARGKINEQQKIQPKDWMITVGSVAMLIIAALSIYFGVRAL